MNDAERWRTIAAWFDEAARTGDFSSQRIRCGLCLALQIAQNSPDYGSNAHSVVMELVYDNYHDYRTREGAGWRACLALLLAHDAEDHGGNHPEEPTP